MQTDTMLHIYFYFKLQKNKSKINLQHIGTGLVFRVDIKLRILLGKCRFEIGLIPLCISPGLLFRDQTFRSVYKAQGVYHGKATHDIQL
jgi:hypothetical protein